jgi:hypothetical protein
MFSRKLTYAAAVLAAVSVGGIPAVAATTGASKHGGTAKSKTQAKAKTKTGPRGQAGKNGKNGKDGKNGKNGKDGKDGKDGSTGAAGAAGPAGANGAAGTVGPAGASFARTVIVSPTGGSALANGTLLVHAVDSISGEGASNPWLVWVEPGSYDLGSAELTLPSYVDLQGSGQDTTKIAGEGAGVVNAATNTEIRELSVSDVDASGSATAIETGGGLRDVSASATIGAGAPSGSSATAVLAENASMPLVDVTASASTPAANEFAYAIDSRGAVQIDGGSYLASGSQATSTAAGLYAEAGANVSDATLEANGTANSYQVDVAGGEVDVIASTLSGGGELDVASGAVLRIGGSLIPGAIIDAGATVACPDDWLPDWTTASTAC